MNILLVGGGGREHALAWKLAQSPGLTRLLAAPGNPGIAEHAELVDLNLADHAKVADFCAQQAVDLVVVGPEAPLVDGLADSLRGKGIAVFGPARAAAQLEGSKGFTKALCAEFGIPTAAYERHDDHAAAIAALANFGLPVVVKADGLAAGKGVTVAATRDEAEAALADLFAVEGAEVVIEAFLDGEEVSLFALSDGRTVIAFGAAQDHKRVGDGDTGPNTGGMGAYSPAHILTPALQEAAMARIVRPTIAAMAARGTPFVGVLFAGLMLTAEGPSLIEYNVRFGDPEAQVLLPRFDGDFAALLHAVATGTLADFGPIDFVEDYALTVVMAARGYPGTPESGGAILLPPVNDHGEAIIFQAGTRAVDGSLVASGGRVLAVTGFGKTAAEAQRRAYSTVDRIEFADGFCRHDIGWREVARENVN